MSGKVSKNSGFGFDNECVISGGSGDHDDDHLLDVPAACRQLGVGKTHLYVLMGDGRLPSVKVGASRRIRASDLRKFVASLEPVPIRKIELVASLATVVR